MQIFAEHVTPLSNYKLKIFQVHFILRTCILMVQYNQVHMCIVKWQALLR